MSDALEKHELELLVRLINARPVELIDLGQSFEALGQLYSEFVHSRGYEHVADNAHLYVVDLRSGSIIASLKGILDQASFLVDHLEVLAGFLANMSELIQFFTLQESGNDKEVAITKSESVHQLLRRGRDRAARAGRAPHKKAAEQSPFAGLLASNLIL